MWPQMHRLRDGSAQNRLEWAQGGGAIRRRCEGRTGRRAEDISNFLCTPLWHLSAKGLFGMLVSGGSFALEGRMLDWSFVEGIPEDGKGKRGEVGGRSAVFHSQSRGGLGGGGTLGTWQLSALIQPPPWPMENGMWMRMWGRCILPLGATVQMEVNMHMAIGCSGAHCASPRTTAFEAPARGKRLMQKGGAPQMPVIRRIHGGASMTQAWMMSRI